MCGIAGHIGPLADVLLDKMAEAIAHRGPDGAGKWRHEAGVAGLVHSRLSIIDLSPLGAQPMWDSSGRYCVTFNGEIYNFADLRDRLSREGCAFRGRSDTEVLIELYAREGISALAQLNGIFAFAIWDKHDQTLLLARDGIGVKPLYWLRLPRGIAFASELKALVQIPGQSRALNPKAIAAYIGLAYSPGEGTAFIGINKWKPGVAAKFDVEGREIQSVHFYRRQTGPINHERSLEDTKDALLDKLDLAVQSQMVSDAPVGAFLSGGLDSSAIVTSAVRNQTAAHLPCYTIRNEGPGETDGFAEDLPYARRVASTLGVELREIVVRPSQLLDLDGLVWMLDEPQPDPAALNAYLIARQARMDGVKVLLSGAGGDDIFSGYRRHVALQAERWWSWLPRPMRSALRASTSGLSRRRSGLRRISKLFAHADSDPRSRLVGYFLWLEDSELMPLFQEEFARSLSASANADLLASHLSTLPADASPLRQMLDLEQTYFLTDHNLNYTDKVTMAAGVETRVPFLEPGLMAFASTIPDQFLVQGTEAKWIFKQAMLSRLPRDIVFRSKSGFGAPLRSWLHGELAPMFDDYLNSGRAAGQGVFRPDAIRALIARDKAGAIDAAYPLLGILCVDSWIRQFGGEPS